MLETIIGILGIAATVVVGFLTIKFTMKKIKNINIHQKADELKDVKGVNMELADGEDIHLKNLNVKQEAGRMDNVTGLDVKISGKQQARLQDIKIEQPNGKVIISDSDDVKVIINKQPEK